MGGNPLALKLVVGMTARFPLPQVLSDLGRPQLGQVEAMYVRIFAAAWEAVSQSARVLLGGMPLVGEHGGNAAHLLAVSGLGEAEFWAALNELLGRSLLEMRGTASERRYGLHALTRSFLLSQR